MTRLVRIGTLRQSIERPATGRARAPFYARLGFLPMNTAMGLWSDPAPAIAKGVLSAPD